MRDLCACLCGRRRCSFCCCVVEMAELFSVFVGVTGVGGDCVLDYDAWCVQLWELLEYRILHSGAMSNFASVKFPFAS